MIGLCMAATVFSETEAPSTPAGMEGLADAVDQGESIAAPDPAATPDPAAEDAVQGSTAKVSKQDATATAKEKYPMVEIKTSKGDIKVRLNREKAPVTVENFLQYVDDGHYNGTIFHRVIENFMIQGGGFMPDMQQKPTRAPIKNEAGNGLQNKRGTLAMARTPAIDSATSQFFVNVVDNAFLDHRSETPQGYGYCVFGEVIDGMDVVDAIKQVDTGKKGPYSDVPVETVEIIEVTRIEE
jgi:cyclophilin family peptidyl-prolyl cis-trans isomerase